MGARSAFFYGKDIHVTEILRSTPEPDQHRTCLTEPGTLMAPQVMHRVCHGTHAPEDWQRNSLSTRPAILHSYRRHKVRSADYPAIVPSSSSSHTVRGTLVTGLTDGDIWRLDIFEGPQYVRRNVKVKLLVEEGDEHGNGNVEGDEIETETYVWKASPRYLEDEEWDFAVFVKEKMRRWIGVENEEEFAEVDEAVAGNDADPTGGRGAKGSITRALEDARTTAKDNLSSAV